MALINERTVLPPVIELVPPEPTAAIFAWPIKERDRQGEVDQIFRIAQAAALERGRILLQCSCGCGLPDRWHN